MTTLRCLHRLSCVAVCALVGLFSWATPARAQVNFSTPAQAEALSSAVKASPELVQGLAKELDSTPEEAAGAAGAIFGIAKLLLKPEDFAAMSRAVPGMEALLAAGPPGVVGTSGAQPMGLGPTPGFASSSSSTPALTAAPVDGNAWAASDLSKLGIKPEMIAKAVPFLSGYLKKHGGAALGSLLGGVFKSGK